MRAMGMFLLTALLSSKLYAATESPTIVPFVDLQESCVQVGEITFGAGGRWNSCHVTRGRWVGTIELTDLYQAQYCLSKDNETCDQKAFVLFANRAYTKDAKALIVRVDPSTATYEDPLIVIIGEERIMSLPTHLSDDETHVDYYVWRTDHWMPIESQTWLHDLSKKLPKDTSVRGAVWPDLLTMTAEVKLFHKSDTDCCPTAGSANIDFGFEHAQFNVEKVHVNSAIK